MRSFRRSAAILATALVAVSLSAGLGYAAQASSGPVATPQTTEWG